MCEKTTSNPVTEVVSAMLVFICVVGYTDFGFIVPPADWLLPPERGSLSKVGKATNRRYARKLLPQSAGAAGGTKADVLSRVASLVLGLGYLFAFGSGATSLSFGLGLPV